MVLREISTIQITGIPIFKMFLELLSKIILEQNTPKGRKANPLVDAISNRHPVTFYYKGPKTPPKDSVKAGVRIRAEAVAMGLSKKGNLIVRAYVQPPSVSKKGYDETNWRTFRVDRMSNINVLTDETFNQQRPGYNPNDESPGSPMVRTLVKANWSEKPEPKKPEIEKPKPQIPEPTAEPEIQTTEPTDKPETLPEPKPIEKPAVNPEDEKSKDFSTDVFNKIQPRDIGGKKVISTQDFENASKELYRLKEKEWMDKQKQVGQNVKPGEGTRRRFEMDSKSEISNLLTKNNINVNDKDENSEVVDRLQESIKRIKTLMLF